MKVVDPRLPPSATMACSGTASLSGPHIPLGTLFSVYVLFLERETWFAARRKRQVELLSLFYIQYILYKRGI
jgi:hypothetical protein